MEGVTFLSRSRTLYGFLNEKGRCSSYKSVFFFSFPHTLTILNHCHIRCPIPIPFCISFVYVGELVLVQNLHTLEILNSNQSINLISAIIGSDVVESTPHGFI